MNFKKIALAFCLFLGFSSYSFAANSNWTGQYQVKMPNEQVEVVTHTPNFVRFMFFTVGKCLFLHKGSSINGIVFKEDVQLCTDSSIDEFTTEVAKLGTIINRSIN